MGDAGQAVDEQQHPLALGAEIFGDRGRAHRGAEAQHRRMVGRHRDDDRALARIAGELGVEEVGDFAAALADQADDDHVGFAPRGDHAHQHRFADARAGDDGDALAQAAVSSALIARTPMSNGSVTRARSSGTALAGQRPVRAPRIGPSPSIGLPSAIDHAAEQGLADLGRRAGRSGAPRARQHAAGPPSAISSVRPLRKPITSA